MGEVPSLFTLCLNAVRNEILRGDDFPRDVYELPSDLFDSLLTCLPPLALHKLQEQMPFENWDDGISADGCFRNQRKRKRYSNFDTLWRTFYKSRWPGRVSKKPPVNWLEGQNADGHKSTNDWQQIYWEAHLQNCLDEAAEIALLPSFDGCIGEVRIPDAVLKAIGYEGHMNCSRPDYAKLSHHCQHFCYLARYLRLQNVLCVAETCNLLRTSKLQCLELRWIKSQEHVEGLCKLLNQNRETLKSLEFVHCKLSSTIVDTICDSLYLKDVHTHTVEHFSIKTSSFLETNQFPLPVGLASFLSSARGNNLRKDDAACLKNALVHMPNLEILDISDNPLEDDGIMILIPYFIEMSEKHSPFKDLKVESCELSCGGVSQLLSVLSTLTGPLNSLSIGGNDLGSKVGAPLGKFLGTGIRALDIEDIELGPSGFLELQEEIIEDLKLVYINISKNRGGNEAAKFLTTLIPRAPELVALNAGYNFMPSQSLLSICSVLKVAKGKLEHVDLTGNNLCVQSADATMLAEFQKNGNPIFLLPTLPASNAPYDDDP
ncbi:uncharacterized protein LOC131313357 isoform X3 [Rhododendron vialii]|uniref:uncharacterized protein LOC131313357 isoform X3 n=1 Tax=Rhododendron vialii TaxID=182163 RepID=UPI00265FE81C|nr:uncharacterized protein LOC131313357 isoform X3 [Rhododendron vialii]